MHRRSQDRALGALLVVAVVSLMWLAPLADGAGRHHHRWHWSYASDYGTGDGLLNSGVACAHGGTLDSSRPIVANRTLPCGTLLWMCHRADGKNRCMRVVVLDRGPYVGGRDFDLGPAVTRRLRFSGLGWLRWRRVFSH